MDVLDAITGLRTAGRLGYATGKALDESGIGSAIGSALAAAPLMLPGGAIEKSAAKVAGKLASRAIPTAADRFAILTAENAGGHAMSATENAARNAALEKELTERGYAFTPVKGRYRDNATNEVLNENSYLIHDLGEREAKLIAKRYGQNGVITHNGYHDLVSNEFFPSKGINPAQDLPFTQLPGGKKFALDIDWSAPQKPAVAALPIRKGANPEVQRVAEEYLRQAGIQGRKLPPVKAVDPEKARLMAQTYEALKSAPNSPEVKQAYDALTREVDAQFNAIKRAGYKIDFVDADPYKNSKEMMDDLAKNRTLRVLKTNAESAHPLLTPEQNDKFRAVHDFFGHAQSGYQFGPRGEEGAFRDHSSMFGDVARRAMATETRGQNSFVNFGPGANLPVTERPFAEQKAALWPEGLLGDYPEMQAPQTSAAAPTSVPKRQTPTTPVYRTDVIEPRAGDPSNDKDLLAWQASGQTEPQVVAWLRQAQNEAYGRRLISAAERGVDQPPIQHDLPRHVGPRIPQSTLDDVQAEAEKTFASPQFLQWVRDGMFGDWYFTRGTQQKAIDALGEEEGPAAYRDLIQKMGATTARSNPDNNLRRASYYRALDLSGLLDPALLRAGRYKRVPEGMGHLANNAHHTALADLAERGSLDPLRNPKPASFVDNLLMNFRPYTNDTRMATGTAAVNPRLVDMGAIVKSVGKDGSVTYSPRDWAYAPLERGFQHSAADYAGRGLLDIPHPDLDPTAVAQAKIWDAIGGVGSNSGTFDDIFNRKLEAAAKRWGVSLDQANKLFWQGNPFDLPLNKSLVPKGLLDY